ncbi:adenosylcobinamide-phosphate synthase CbiB [Bacillus sp. 03113]|uniref:adenosylcobinamide-phosphate synthase CbiB n=1 Tax=Bacillus sp. 03113 TaxID=2578211 RepID=UPI001143652B|nr:adenosylcobinamide-phosphate synthase CbiB [Bacillus sp. 03113]
MLIFYHLIAMILAFIIDRIIGDPPHWPHPVKWIGSLISILDKNWNKGTRKKEKGLGMLMTVLLIVFSSTFFITWSFYQLHPLAGVLVESIIISTTIAQKSLMEAAMDVYIPLKAGNLQEARLKLSYIVGRDTEQLNESEVVRATVETVAENTSDGVTAPLFWAFIGGAPLAMVYRAINTCDSMVGYKNDIYKDFGWASAKLDDVVNWIPSRLTAFLLLLTRKPVHFSSNAAWKVLFRDAVQHPSPNSGWGEAAVAALLGVQLGGVNYYKGKISNRAKMGDPIVSLDHTHILKAINLLKSASLSFLMTLLIGGIIYVLAVTWC